MSRKRRVFLILPTALWLLCLAAMLVISGTHNQFKGLLAVDLGGYQAVSLTELSESIQIPHDIVTIHTEPEGHAYALIRTRASNVSLLGNRLLADLSLLGMEGVRAVNVHRYAAFARFLRVTAYGLCLMLGVTLIPSRPAGAGWGYRLARVMVIMAGVGAAVCWPLVSWEGLPTLADAELMAQIPLPENAAALTLLYRSAVLGGILAALAVGLRLLWAAAVRRD